MIGLVVVTLATKLDKSSDLCIQCLSIDVVGRRKIFHANPQRFEKGYLVVAFAAFLFLLQQLAQLRKNVLVGDCAFLFREQKIAAFIER